MRFVVPIYVAVEAANQQQAEQMKKAIEELIQAPIVRYSLTSKGVNLHDQKVGDPVPLPIEERR